MFECGGAVPGGAGIGDYDVRPLAFEATAIAGDRLPGSSRANGGRCCPHSFNPKYSTRRGFECSSQALGTGGSPS